MLIEAIVFFDAGYRFFFTTSFVPRANLQSNCRSSAFDGNVKMQSSKFNWELPYRCQYRRATWTLLPRRALDLCGIFIKYTQNTDESQT